jgi:hypothetical protein
MKLNITRSKKMTGAEVQNRKIDRVESDIANAQRVLAWQLSEGYEMQAELSRQLITKLQAKLGKLV